jgi:hypothetical protein
MRLFLLAAISQGQNTRLAQLGAKNLLLLRFKFFVCDNTAATQTAKRSM